MNHKSSGYCKTELNQALIEWHPTETSVDEVEQDQNVAKGDFL